MLPGNLHFQSTTFLCLCEVTIPCNAFHMVKESWSAGVWRLEHPLIVYCFKVYFHMNINYPDVRVVLVLFFLIIKEAFPNKSVLFWSFDLIFQPSCSFVIAVNFNKTFSWINNQYYKTTFLASTWVYVEKLLNIIEKWDAIEFVHFINWAIRVCLLVLFDFI